MNPLPAVALFPSFFRLLLALFFFPSIAFGYENRGRILLVIDNTIASAIRLELNQLNHDLVGDGWTVDEITVDRAEAFDTTKVETTKTAVVNWYSANSTDARVIYLIGRVPVPYSGHVALDGHDNHDGAWPADYYYAEMDGSWTDTAVSSGNARPATDNTAGDGKYDQGNRFFAFGNPELEYARLDFYGISVFRQTEIELLKRYLNKAHRWKHGEIPVQSKAYLDYHFGARGAGPALITELEDNVGAGNVDGGASQSGSGSFMPHLVANDYLWAYGDGSGQYISSEGIGESYAFAMKERKAAFIQLFGSYYGDYDNGDNFLRVPLGMENYGLLSVWGDRPRWDFSDMARGETAGYAALYSLTGQGYTGTDTFYRAWTIHKTLLGDPSLRQHQVAPITNLDANFVSSDVALSWTDSDDASSGFFLGYHVYRAASLGGTFTRLNGSVLTGTTYTDTSPLSGDAVYMVRAIMNQTHPGGTYENASQGVFIYVATTAPTAPDGLAATVLTSERVDLSWTDNSNNEAGFAIERSTTSGGDFMQIAIIPYDQTTYTDEAVNNGTTYYYRVTALSASTDSAASSEAPAHVALTAPSSPSNLNASLTQEMDILIRWDDNSPVETGYTVERSTIPDSGFMQIATLPANTTGYLDTSVAADTIYYYQVKATGSDADSAYSTKVSETTAFHFSFDHYYDTDLNQGTYNGGISVGWGGNSRSSVVVRRHADRGSNGAGVLIRDVDVQWNGNAGHRYIPNDAQLGGTFDSSSSIVDYTFWLHMPATTEDTNNSGVLTFGNGHDAAYVFVKDNGTVRYTPGTSGSVTFVDSGGGTIDLSSDWHKVQVRVKHDSITANRYVQFAINDVLQTNGGSTPDGRFEWRETGDDQSIDGARIFISPWAGGTQETNDVYIDDLSIALGEMSATSAPGNLTADADGTDIIVSWIDNSSDESAFVLETSSDGGDWSHLATLPANTAVYYHTGLTAATTYYYRVKATLTFDSSDYSSTASATTSLPQHNVYEGFDYTSEGTLGNGNGGYGWNGAWGENGTVSGGVTGSSPIAITANSMSVPGGYGASVNGNKLGDGPHYGVFAMRTLTNAIDLDVNDTVYISVIASTTGSGGTAYVFLGFIEQGTAARRLFDIGPWKSGVFLREGSAELSAGSYIPGTDVLIVGKITTAASGNDTIQLKVYTAADTIGNEPSTWDATHSFDSSAIIDRISVETSGIQTGYLDEIRISSRFTETVAASINHWTAEAGLSGNDADPNADPDNNGLPNIMEYGLGMKAGSTDFSKLPMPGKTHVASQDYFTLDYRQLTGAGDITYTVQYSEDLVTWNSAIHQISVSDNGDGTETVTVHYPDPIANSEQFLRLKINE